METEIWKDSDPPRPAPKLKWQAVHVLVRMRRGRPCCQSPSKGTVSWQWAPCRQAQVLTGLWAGTILKPAYASGLRAEMQLLGAGLVPARV